MAEVLSQLIRFEVHSEGIGPDILSNICNKINLNYNIAANKIRYYFRIYMKSQSCRKCGHSTHWRNDYTCYCKCNKFISENKCNKNRSCCKDVLNFGYEYYIIDGPYDVNGPTRELIDSSGNYDGDVYKFGNIYKSLDQYWDRVDTYYKNKSKYKYDPDCFEEKYPL